jgi:hypothetical protein
MKIKKQQIIFFLLLIIFCACTHKHAATIETNKSQTKASTVSKGDDSLCVFHEINLKNEANLFSKVGTLTNTCFLGNNIYLLSKEEKKVFVINIVNQTVTEYKKLNYLIDSLSMFYSNPTQLYIDSKGTFVGFENGIVKISKDFKVKMAIRIKPPYDAFEIFHENRLAVFGMDSVFMFNSTNGMPIKQFKSDLFGGSHVKSSDGIFLSFKVLDKLVCKNDSIQIEQEIAPKQIKTIDPLQDGYAGYVTKNYILWFIYGDRKKMLILNRKIDRILKIIPFNKFDLSTENQDQVNYNENYRDFSIEMKGNSFYIIRFKNHALSLFKGCLGNINESN